MTSAFSEPARYRPGRWTAVVGRGCALLMDLSPDAGLVRRCWELAEPGADAATLIAAVAHEGLRGVRSFAIVSADQVFVRGDAEVDVGDDTGSERTLTGADALTWTEHRGPLTRAVLRGKAVSDDVELPIGLGVVLADQVALGPTAARSEVDAPVAEPADERPAVPQELVATPQPEPEQRRNYDDLFHYTVAPPEKPAPQTRTMSTETLEPVHTEVPAPKPPAAPPPPPGPVPPPSAEVITHLDWAAPADNGTVGTWSEPVTSAVPADVSATIVRPRGAGRPGPSESPMVTSVRCAAQHQSPAGLPLCRVCGGPVPDQEPFSAPRPPLGVLRLSTGDTISLDRDILLGRNPRTDGTDPVRPHEVRLDNGLGDISNNHVEVKLDGWDVVVVDLNSTNGTTVTTPAGITVDLPRGGARLLEPGGRVNLADDTWFRFEVSS